MSMTELKINYLSFHPKRGRILLVLCFFFMFALAFGQESTNISTAVDTTAIRIGEQVKYTVQVETDSSDAVVFPEGQTFLPLELVEIVDTDTLKEGSRQKFIREYALTQFDSGTYKLPKQLILVNNKPFYTDSLSIYVNTVAVDTTKQKMYDIKTFVPIEKDYSHVWKYVLICLMLLTILGVLLYWFFYRRPLLSEEEQIAALPPYDRALMELKKLDESKYLIQSDYKHYYTDLTNIIRSYLEDDVHITALESTTDELIDKLEMLSDSGSLKLDGESISQFKKVLQTADLVKFAKSTPENSVVENDRKTVEQLVVRTKEALPEPTEEELMQDEQFLKDLKRRKQKQRLVKFAMATGVVLILVLVGSGFYFGFNNVKDSLVGHPGRELIKGDWYASEYGYPAVYVETPGVLRRIETRVAEKGQEGISTRQSFSMGDAGDYFYMRLSSATYANEEAFKIKEEVDQAIKMLEESGARNLIVKEDEYTTPSGAKGSKIFGAFEQGEEGDGTKMEYQILNFVEHGGFQQLILVHEAGDRYAPEIVDRILGSLEFKTAG